MKILLACGGTGGHVFPGVALAENFEKKVRGVEIVFIGTPRGIEKDVIGKTKWRLEMIETPTFADKNGFRKLSAVFKLFGAFRQSRLLLKKERPSLVVGVGGYVAAPLLIMASLMCIPTLTLEPNAIPGLSNRLLKYFTTRVVTSYPEAQKYFGKKGLLLGVPVRGEILRESRVPSPKKVIFIFGGSRGAKAINEGITKALPYLKDLKNGIHFVHQVGPQSNPEIFSAAYQQQGMSAEVYPFIEKMGIFYAKADLVIARAGANTVAELVAVGIPGLLIPYPHAQGNHQEANARYLEKSGGALVLLESEMSGERLARMIRELLTTPETLKTMAANLTKLGWNNAAEKIVEECLKRIKDVLMC